MKPFSLFSILIISLFMVQGVQGDTLGAVITLKSDSSILAVGLGSGAPSSALVAELDTVANIDTLSFIPCLVAAEGTYTPVPPNAPAGTNVINIPPGDGENGYFKTTFTLPQNYLNISLLGSANIDDYGRVFLNGYPLSPSLNSTGDSTLITETGNATFGTTNNAYFHSGTNVLVFSDDNTGGGPSGAAFFVVISYSLNANAVRPLATRFQTSAIGYNGVLAVYSLNGRQILKTSFTASTTKESILRGINKIPAMGVYEYRFLKDRNVMDEGNFIVK